MADVDEAADVRSGPIELLEVRDPGPEPPQDRGQWDPDAHDAEDVREFVVVTDLEA